MLQTETDGMQVGDLILTQNLPRWGMFSIVRLDGSYDYQMGAARSWGDRFGHVLPVSLLAKEIDRTSSAVNEALRRAIALQPRLYNITPYGGYVEDLVRP